ncbi:MAG: ADP-dependent NAD(P)H-hydrate dehydratase / NAD(P)H-hydrate epimerase [Desulfonauticus sp.]|jgi:hypothetical protein|nr:MAG: Uncharacterized protein XD41_1299 [Desulfonauticus sp. 38_4375]MDK2922123.1 ADP-dependent NAD(P)H-hydrate dehydratase / NAD(P)H-hydrate epimerase [Desulfonauticus sp.]
MLVLAGTYPSLNCPLLTGVYELRGTNIFLKDFKLEINRGTTALAATALLVCKELGLDAPYLCLAGDIGRGEGTHRVYSFLQKELAKLAPRVITFHYLLPDVDWQYKLFWAIEELPTKPFLIADAGHMYAAKMSGLAGKYDLFTPDLGELAFLADEKAPHPFYTRGFILHQEEERETLLKRSYAHNNASTFMLVKGREDLVVERGVIRSKIDAPCVEALEAIGGTGDTLTGLVSALIYAGFDVPGAMELAAKVNRVAGAKTNPSPATQIETIIQKIPEALKEVKNA